MAVALDSRKTHRPARIFAALTLVAAGNSVLANDCETCSGYEIETRLTHEVWRNTRGGIEPGNVSLDKLDVAFLLNGERALNTPGFTLFARGIYDAAGSFSGNFVGDAQGVSSIEAPEGLRLLELWTEWSIGSHMELRTGLYDFNSEFDSNSTAALFIHSSFGMGKDVSQSGEAGPSTFPVTSLGARVRWTVARGWSVQIAALDGVPGDPEHPRRTTVKLNQGDGALLAGEVDYYGDRLSKVALGTWRYTSRFRTFDAAEESGAQTTYSHGAFMLAETVLRRPAGNHRGQLTSFVRAGIADDAVNRFASFTSLGLVCSGLVMKDDQLGFAVARAANGTGYRHALARAGIASDSAETNVELTWRFTLNSWLAVQPDVQYILNPNTDPALGHALALGVRFELATP